MAMKFAHAHTDDPFELATASNIILVDRSGGIRREFVEVLSELGIYIADSTLTPLAIKPVTQYQVEYEVRKNNLVVPLGAAVGSNSILVTALSVNCDSGSYPKVSVTGIKFSNANKIMSPPVAPGDITITGGYGLVNKWGATTAKGISSSLSISMQQVEAMEETSGDYLEDGYVQYGFKAEVSIESYESSTPPAYGYITERDDNHSKRDGMQVFSLSYFYYLPTA